MEHPKFDPFKQRLARDIRNDLSTALIESLEAGHPARFRSIAQRFLQRDIELMHREYIENRLRKYEQVLSEITSRNVDDPFAQVVLLWNKGLLFEVHERLESIWQDLPPETRKAVKGIIQATAAYIHKQYGHKKAARSLAQKAAGLLRDYGKALPPFIQIDELIDRLDSQNFEPPAIG